MGEPQGRRLQRLLVVGSWIAAVGILLGLKGGAVTTIAYKKGASGDDLKLICAFNRKLV